MWVDIPHFFGMPANPNGPAGAIPAAQIDPIFTR